MVFNLIQKERPNLVVELGSGSSTVVAGYALQKNGLGKIHSLDHLEEYAQQTREMVSLHGLNTHCHVHHAPLKSYRLEDNTWRWYDLDHFDPESTVDMVVVDGPPGELQKMSRYPALALMSDFLSDRFIIVIDDGSRKDEQETVQYWRERFNLEGKFRGLEKGTYILWNN